MTQQTTTELIASTLAQINFEISAINKALDEGASAAEVFNDLTNVQNSVPHVEKWLEVLQG